MRELRQRLLPAARSLRPDVSTHDNHFERWGYRRCPVPTTERHHERQRATRRSNNDRVPETRVESLGIHVMIVRPEPRFSHTAVDGPDGVDVGATK